MLQSLALLPARQLITASDTVPPLFTATTQMRPGVAFWKPRVEFAGTVTESGAVTAIAVSAPLAGVAERNANHTGSAADGSAPASVFTAIVSALEPTDGTSWPLSMLRPNAAADCARVAAETLPAGGVSSPPSASTLPVASAKVATCPAVDEPGPVTLPVPIGGCKPAAAALFASTMVQSACVPAPPVAVTFTVSNVPL